MKDKILELRNQGLSYNAIAQTLGCSKGTVAYHANTTTKEKQMARQRTPSRLLTRKIAVFRNRSQGDKIKLVDHSDKYGVKEVLEKLGSSPRCYLTGVPIDISDTSSWTLDHVVPVSKGGNNSLDNMGFALRQANQAKVDMSVQEFVELCKLVVAHNAT